MELGLDFRKVFCCKTPGEKKAVIPVDCSIVLPDYYPDVMKILRYTAKTVKSPVFSEGGTETVSGNINIEVSYVSEEGELCSCSQLRPFSHSFECGENVSAAECSVAVGEIGCRAVNKRRIDLHGSIEATLRVLSGEEKSVVSAAEGAGAVSKNKSADFIIPVGEFYKTFTMEEKGVPEEGKPPFGKILWTSAFAEVTECHVIQDKIVTKGEVKIDVLWAPQETENGEKGPFLSSFSYPVSRMAEADGILLTDICDARYEADFPEISPSADGENLDIKIRIGIFARVYRKEKADYVADMFSADYESKTEKTSVSMISEAIPVSETEAVFEKFDLPEAAGEITDMWLETNEPDITPQGDISLSAKLCMFAKDEDNPVYFEKNLEHTLRSPAKGKDIVFYNLSAGVRNSEFAVGSGGKAEFSANVLIDGTIYTALSTECVSSCSVKTEKKIEHGGSALTLCYAEKGEDIWDIAKRYRVSPERIMEENGIREDVLLEKTMLVITR